jgi:two-component system, OmpR family, alkaline phosphatase synthesis response regulator PhoP
MDDRQILIVDHDPLSRKLLAVSLRAAGYTSVAQAASTSAAQRTVSAQRPALVLLGFQVPTDGSALFIRAMKKTPGTMPIPVIGLGTYSGAVVRAAADDADCDAYFVKPISVSVVLAEVERLLAPRE